MQLLASAVEGAAAPVVTPHVLPRGSTASGAAKKVAGLLATPVPGKLRLYLSIARKKKSLSLMIGPPTPPPTCLRQSLGLIWLITGAPAALMVVSWVVGLRVPHSASRS